VRWVLVLALVGCPRRPNVDPPPIEPASARPIEPPLVAVSPPASTPVETVDGPTSTPGRHPTIPRGPSTTKLNPMAIRRVIKAQMAPIVECYQRLSPADRRRLIVRFTIGPTGEVLSSKASGAQAKLENCIAAAFDGITFEKPADGGTLTVTYPLHFRPG
jgi:hypothetical protein